MLEVEATPVEDVVESVERTTEELEYDRNSVDTTAAGAETIESNLKEVLLWVKCCPRASHATEKSFVKGRVNGCGKLLSDLLTRNHGLSLGSLGRCEVRP